MFIFANYRKIFRYMNFKLWNNITGWVVFAIAATVYLLTMEPSSSLWDCSEFIATSYKLEVGHPPGAPLFMMMARIATLFAPSTHYVPIMVNGMNSIASAFCILFLFWTITHIGRRFFTRSGRELSKADAIAVLGAGVVGALAYAFTDTFWFSAYEGEVYALSSMFTTLVVWLMFKWEEHADEPHAVRWLILVAYLMGLSIGVHLLNLLTLPALVFIYYFRKAKKVTVKGCILATIVAVAILGVVNGIIIPYTVYVGAMVDVLFVNKFHLPVNSGMIFYVFALFALCGGAIYYTHRKGMVLANTIVLALTMILLGFSSYASVTIRAAVNPPMNSNDPDNPHALLSVLNRDQYGVAPLLKGPYYTAYDSQKYDSHDDYIGAIDDYEYEDYYWFNRDSGSYQKDKRLVGYKFSPDLIHFFPRMWNPVKDDIEYAGWANYKTRYEQYQDEDGSLYVESVREPTKKTRFAVKGDRPGRKSGRLIEPTFGENLNYFINYQLGYMYLRYFMWNFVGRQDDIQPANTITNGNWISGIRFIDEAFVGPQTDLPHEVESNRARNKYYFIPFILGLIGLFYQLMRDQRNFVVVSWLFIMMGFALVVYFNTSPSEPRERDYVYAGSFYAFCIWIGLGVLAVKEFFEHISKRSNAAVSAAATVVCLSVPVILCAQNWDDHDRSGRTIARDMGWNYLQSVPHNAIIINYGDNDTFPLWFNQEVDGVRLDVRIMNTSYLGGEWDIDEMKGAANEAAGVPFSLPRSKYWNTNSSIWVIPLSDTLRMDIKDVIDFIRSDDKITKYDGLDYIPARKIVLPVDKDNAIAAGIVREEDRDLMVDEIVIDLKGRSLDRSDMMLLDLLANFDWKRPISFTQVHFLRKFGLRDYLQFDGYSYRLVPIKTPARGIDIGRIDPDYVYPLLMETFRYGNLADPKVYVDYFIQYNLEVSGAREAFARAAKAFIERDDDGDREKALALLDRGLEVLPTSQIRFTETNAIPFIECYYLLGENDKANALLLEYAHTIMEYIEHYDRLQNGYREAVGGLINTNVEMLEMLLYYALRYKQEDAAREIWSKLREYYSDIPNIKVPEEELAEAETYLFGVFDNQGCYEGYEDNEDAYYGAEEYDDDALAMREYTVSDDADIDYIVNDIVSILGAQQ